MLEPCRGCTNSDLTALVTLESRQRLAKGFPGPVGIPEQFVHNASASFTICPKAEITDPSKGPLAW